MISRYLEYVEELKGNDKIIQKGEGDTLIVFSRTNKPFVIPSNTTETFSSIFELLLERAEEFEMDIFNAKDDEDITEEDDEKTILYGSLVDCFESENMIKDIEPRDIVLVELENFPNENDTIFEQPIFSDESLLVFGHLNSGDIYLRPRDIEILIEDLTWLVNESNRLKESTKTTVIQLISSLKNEIQSISNGEKHSNIFTKGL